MNHCDTFWPRLKRNQKKFLREIHTHFTRENGALSDDEVGFHLVQYVTDRNSHINIVNYAFRVDSNNIIPEENPLNGVDNMYVALCKNAEPSEDDMSRVYQ